MVTLSWSSTLELGFPPIDNLHRNLVDVLASAEECEDADVTAHWQALVACAQTLFENEDRWMKRTGFASAPHHALEHRVVLNVLREGLVMSRQGELAKVRTLTQELARWLPKHIQSLDAALALHLRRHPDIAQTHVH